MNTRRKIMGLAALPLAGLLATGGVAMAQSAGAPSSSPYLGFAGMDAAPAAAPRGIRSWQKGPKS